MVPKTHSFEKGRRSIICEKMIFDSQHVMKRIIKGDEHVHVYASAHSMYVRFDTYFCYFFSCQRARTTMAVTNTISVRLCWPCWAGHLGHWVGLCAQRNLVRSIAIVGIFTGSTRRVLGESVDWLYRKTYPWNGNSDECVDAYSWTASVFWI